MDLKAVDNVFDVKMHQEKRKDFYSKLDGFYPDIYGHEYALYDYHSISLKKAHEIQVASKKVRNIFFKLSKVLQKLPAEHLLEMGYPKETLEFLNLHSLSLPTVIARIDFADTLEGLKVLELNSDTPTFIKEVFSVNGEVATHFGLQNPNEGDLQILSSALNRAIAEAFDGLRINHAPNIVFTSHGGHIEDLRTTEFLMSLVKYEASYTALEDLKIVTEDIFEDGRLVFEKGLYDDNGYKIDILYRQTYPIEYLVKDEDESGFHIGQFILQLVKEGSLSIINPLSAFLLQSKALLALIWAFHEENHSFFTEEEHSWIDSYFLPTYFEPDLFIEKEIAFVKKPVFGREGDTVEIFDENGAIITEDQYKSYKDFVSIYQKYVDLPCKMIKTIEGIKNASLLYTCFLIGGKPTGIGIRAGKQITDDMAYFLPVTVKEDEKC